MKKLFYITLAGAAIFAAGCSTVKTVQRTDPRSPVPLASVQLSLRPPDGGKLLAEIYATAPDSPKGIESAQLALKQKAAAMGANCLVIAEHNENTIFDDPDGRFRVHGDAYFVQQ